MAATEADLFSLLTSLSIPVTTFSHPEVKTVDEWRPHITTHFTGKSGPAALSTKSLFFKDKNDQFYLLVALADTPMDLKHLTKTLKLSSGSLRFGPPEALKQLLNAEQGAGEKQIICCLLFVFLFFFLFLCILLFLFLKKKKNSDPLRYSQ